MYPNDKGREYFDKLLEIKFSLNNKMESRVEFIRNNIHEKITIAEREYINKHGEMPKLLYLDCFTIKLLEYESNQLICKSNSKIEYRGMSIIPVESIDEIIRADTDDYDEMIGRLRRKHKFNTFAIVKGDE